MIRGSFANLLGGLGLANPKAAANTYLNVGCSPGEIDAAYRGSTWFARIVDDRADDSVSSWRQWMATADQATALERLETELDVLAKTRRALIMSRLYGGAAVYLGGLPGAPDTPVDLNRVGAGALKYLTPISRHEVSAGGLIPDPMHPRYGEPEHYMWRGVTIHPSRLVIFTGRRGGEYTHSDGWGDPLWTQLRDAVTSADAALAVIGDLMLEAKTDIVRVQGLMQNAVSDEYTQLLTQRFRMAQTLKSATGVTLLDGDDEWDQRQITWAGMASVVELQLTALAGAAGYPVTRLLGTSAKGLNATGDGDLRNYYDTVAREQRTVLDPAMRTLNECLIRSALGSRPSEVWYEWRPLWTPTARERAEVAKIEAETDRLLLDGGLVPPDVMSRAVISRLSRSDQYPGIDDAEDFEMEPLVTDAEPRSLYVRRQVTNAADIVKWAKKAGLKDLVPAEDMHVTIVYSRASVDWMAMGEGYPGGKVEVSAGGPRIVSVFGNEKPVTVLEFASSVLSYRHEEARRAGASHDWGEYMPHITVATGAQTAVEPYRGKIDLGPEIFEEIKS